MDFSVIICVVLKWFSYVFVKGVVNLFVRRVVENVLNIVFWFMLMFVVILGVRMLKL